MTEEVWKDMATTKHVKAIIRFRRATENEWIQANPILRLGEPAFSTDTNQIKIGDGKKPWLELDYINANVDEQVEFVDSLDGIEGQEDRLYINKTDGTAHLWKDDQFIEMESSSIGELDNRITTNSEKIAALEEEVKQGADKNYVHKQQVASDTWTVVHNLGKYPSITVVDSAGTVVVGEIILQTTEQAVISFNGAFSGKAYCN